MLTVSQIAKEYSLPLGTVNSRIRILGVQADRKTGNVRQYNARTVKQIVSAMKKGRPLKSLA